MWHCVLIWYWSTLYCMFLWYCSTLQCFFFFQYLRTATWIKFHAGSWEGGTGERGRERILHWTLGERGRERILQWTLERGAGRKSSNGLHEAIHCKLYHLGSRNSPGTLKPNTWMKDKNIVQLWCNSKDCNNRGSDNDVHHCVEKADFACSV